jgi:peroxiredoxin
MNFIFIRYRIIVALLIFTGILNKAQSQSIGSSTLNFTITGTVNEMTTGTMMLAYPDTSGQNRILDSAVIEKGTFKFTGRVELPVPARIYLKGSNNRFTEKNISFYLENSHITVWVNKDSMYLSKVSGSKSNDDKDSITAMLAPYYETNSSLRKVREFAAKNQFTSILKNVENILEELPAAQRKLFVDYAMAHPNSYSITSMLDMNFTNNQTNLPLLKKVYANFSEDVKKSFGGKDIAALINRIERVEIGNSAPLFNMPDENGKMVSLSSFKGKYILLDFWASWCVPCREESPHLVKAYENYKNRNFTIISISLDNEKDKQKWINAFKNDGMLWTQLSNLKGYIDDPVQALYSVQGIPDNFLINSEGKIIARNLRGDDLEKKLAEIL